jgi:UDP-3-O-[3-hydroxymyristoyl] N-acetylglucosamine deacetylase
MESTVASQIFDGPSQPDSQTCLNQQTLADQIVCEGVGLHSGAQVQVRVLPAEVGRGRYFVRADLPGQPEIAAQVNSISQTVLSTELTQGAVHIRTVEHLLAALVGMGVDNARIEVTGPEIPLLDGSAQEWVSAIAKVGLVAQSTRRPRWHLAEPIWVRDQDAFVAALPASELRFTYGIDFDLAAIGNQWYSWSPTSSLLQADSSFAKEIAPARTFGLAHQVEYLRSQGLIRGGNLENALVCGPNGWLNPPLRFPNEPVRHKLLDLVGDLSLVGTLPTAHFLAYKASHQLHTQLVRSLVSLKS